MGKVTHGKSFANYIGTLLIGVSLSKSHTDEMVKKLAMRHVCNHGLQRCSRLLFCLLNILNAQIYYEENFVTRGL